jgi:hypothetical protein
VIAIPVMVSVVEQPVRKCRCLSGDHGHEPGKCSNLATERDQLCKPCSDREAADLQAKGKTGRSAEPSASKRKKGPTLRPTG